MIINHNITALNTHRQMSSATNAQANSMEKLSSGMRINSAKDDAAGLSISEKMRGQIRGLEQASNNAQDGISLMQTAEGALNETHDILQRMRELAVQSANDTNTDSDRGEIQKEIDSLTSEINRIGNTTEFNTQKLVDGSKDTATVAAAATAGTPATAGVYTLAAAPTADITIDGVDFTYSATSGPGVFSDNDELIGLINGNATLSAKYTASTSGTDVVLTQRAGQESSTAPTSGATFAVTTAGAAAVAATAEVEAGVGLQFQIGANENQSLTLEISDMRAKALGLSGAVGGSFTAATTVTDGTNNTKSEAALDVSTAAKSASAITVINEAIETVSAERSKLGANQNRLEHTINNLGTTSQNLTSAESRIRDVDYAEAA